MSIVASEFLVLLSHPEHVGPITQPFSQAHLFEKAYVMSEMFCEAEKFWLSQLVGVNPVKWRVIQRADGPNVSSYNYREMQTWGTFSKTVRFRCTIFHRLSFSNAKLYSRTSLRGLSRMKLLGFGSQRLSSGSYVAVTHLLTTAPIMSSLSRLPIKLQWHCWPLRQCPTRSSTVQ